MRILLPFYNYLLEGTSCSLPPAQPFDKNNNWLEKETMKQWRNQHTTDFKWANRHTTNVKWTINTHLISNEPMNSILVHKTIPQFIPLVVLVPFFSTFDSKLLICFSQHIPVGSTDFGQIVACYIQSFSSRSGKCNEMAG